MWLPQRDTAGKYFKIFFCVRHFPSLFFPILIFCGRKQRNGRRTEHGCRRVASATNNLIAIIVTPALAANLQSVLQSTGVEGATKELLAIRGVGPALSNLSRFCPPGLPQWLLSLGSTVSNQKDSWSLVSEIRLSVIYLQLLVSRRLSESLRFWTR